MKKIIIIFIISISIFIYFGLFNKTDENTQKKVDLLKSELIKSNYKPIWIIISKKRSNFFNKILPFSSKDSYHLKGKAIDIYVFDINNDTIFDEKDIEIIKKHIFKIEKKFPELQGGFGTYLSKDISKRMIHIDTRGYRKIWNN